MAGKPICLVCKREMVRGFLTDQSDYSRINQPRWCEGSPQHAFLSGEVKMSQFKQGIQVVAFRCPECEALRLYAPSKE